MALTGRTAVLAVAGALLLLLLPSTANTLLVVDATLVGLIVVDIALAGSVRALRVERTGAASVRLGEPVEITLTVVNANARRVRLALRDAWPPSAGSAPRVHHVDVP